MCLILCQVIGEPLLSPARQLVAKQGTAEASSAASDKHRIPVTLNPPPCSCPPIVSKTRKRD